MSDNPHASVAPCFALPEYSVVSITGRDAGAFAQSQFMNDVGALGDGQWQWNGWLDAKGRVQALFALLRRDPETLWLLTASDPSTLATALRRFIFRSRVTVDVRGERVSGTLARVEAARGNQAAPGASGAVELDLSGGAAARTLVVGGDPAEPSPELAEAWWLIDMAHGWPALPGVDLASWTPQQLSLQRLSAFSVRKGCYPGQEIVARTHFLGRAKRGLVRLEGTRAAAGTDVADASGRPIGQVVCTIGGSTLAVIPLDREEPEVHIDARAYTPVPLLDGLER